VLALPPDQVETSEARAAMPEEVPLGDAVHNTAHAALLVLGLARDDFSLIGRGLRVALERADSFGKLLATGLTSVIALQTFVIVAGVTRLIPLTGVPLPLVSYGGSSKIATFIILGLLVRLSSGPWEPSRG